jgi:ERCC4-type nuclease
MLLLLDERETQLYDTCVKLLSHNSPVIIDKQVLHLGDAAIKESADGPDIVIFERKSIRDLLASIKDGRYEEQSHRLIHSSGISTHNILYVIEGMYSQQTRTDQEKQTVLSAMTSLNLLKGFSVFRTCSLNETAELLVSITSKIEREFKKGKSFAFSKKDAFSLESADTAVAPLENVVLESPGIQRYCEVVKKVKKENITPENVGEMILSQIPGISATTAIAIMSHFTSFSDFMQKVSENPEILKNMTYTDHSGKTRKISGTVLQNVIVYLFGKKPI